MADELDRACIAIRCARAELRNTSTRNVNVALTLQQLSVTLERTLVS
jgi:hypothetical protein